MLNFNPQITTHVRATYLEIWHQLQSNLIVLQSGVGDVHLIAKNLTELIVKANKIHNNHPENEQIPFLVWVLWGSMDSSTHEKKAIADTLLIAHECGLEHRITYQNNSLLAMACYNGFNAYVTILVDKIKLKYMESKDEPHPIAIAQMKKNTTLFDYLCQNVSKYSMYEDSSVSTMAARYGYLPLIKNLLQKEPESINQLDQSGKTLLMYAVYHNRINVVKHLLQQGAVLSLQDCSGQNVFHQIFASDDSTWVNEFITDPIYCFNTEVTLDRPLDKNGSHPMHHALKRKDFDLIRTILQAQPQLVHVKDRKGRSLLYYSICNQDFAVFKLLVEDYGLEFPPDSLCYCGEYNAIEIAQYIQQKQGINFNPSHPIERPALVLAVLKGHREMTDWLLSLTSIEFIKAIADYNYHVKTLGHLMVKHNMHDLIIKHDLGKKDLRFLYLPDSNNMTCVDYFIELHSADFEQSLLDFMTYVISSFKVNGAQWPDFSRKVQLEKLLDYCLRHRLLTINDYINDGKPIVHLLEELAYQDISTNNVPTDSEAYSRYINKINMIAKDYPEVNFNAKDNNKRSLLANLIAKGSESVPRIQCLLAMQGFQLNKLDELESNLLHLAIQIGLYDLVVYCVEEKKLSILKKRKDKQSALDLALDSQNMRIINLLWAQCDETQKKAYIAALSAEDERIVLLPVPKPLPVLVKIESKPLALVCDEIAEIKTVTIMELCEELKRLIIKKLNDEDKQYPSSSNKGSHSSIINKIKLLKHQVNMQMDSADAKELIALSVQLDRYHVLAQVFRIPSLLKLIDLHDYSTLISSAISANKARNCALFIKYLQISHLSEPNKEQRQEWLHNSLAYYQVLQVLLQTPATAKGIDLLPLLIAAIKNNHLESARLLVPQIKDYKKLVQSANQIICDAILYTQNAEFIDYLLNIEDIAAHAADMNQAALRATIHLNDVEICALLMEVPVVRQSLEANQQAELKHLLNDFPQSHYEPDCLKLIADSVLEQPCFEYKDSMLELTVETHPVEYKTRPVYYLTSNVFYLITPQDYFNAIFFDDYPLFSHLLTSSCGYPTQFVRDLLSAAIGFGRQAIVNQLISFAYNEIAYQPTFANAMICKAVRLGLTSIAFDLYHLPSVQGHLGLFNHRLFRVCLLNHSEPMLSRLVFDEDINSLLRLWNGYLIKKAEKLDAHYVSSVFQQHQRASVSVSSQSIFKCNPQEKLPSPTNLMIVIEKDLNSDCLRPNM